MILPNYPELSAEFYAAFVRYVHELSRSSGITGAIRTSVIHEGVENKIKRADEESYEAVQTKEFSAESVISFRDIENVNLGFVVKEAQKIGATMYENMSRHAFETMNDITAKMGQVIDGGGAPLSLDLMYKMLEMMPQEYDDITGRPKTTIITSPQMVPQMVALEKQLADNPLQKKRFADLEIKKRDEFRSREMDRDLAG